MAFDWAFLLGDDVITTNDENETDNPEFRYLESNIGIQPNPRNNYGFPHEMVEMFKNSNLSSGDELEDLSRLSADDD